MNKMKEINIGIVGVGLLGNYHNQAIQTVAEGPYFPEDVRISVRAICDNRESHVQEYAKTWNIPNVFTDWKDVLEMDAINTIYIATPTVSHKDIFIAAADAGKHIFVQKPLAFTLEDIQEMIEARDRNGVYVQVGHTLRSHPGFWAIRRICRNPNYKKRMGRLFNIHFRSDQEKPYTGGGFHPSLWRQDKKQAYAGTLFEHSIHDFDLMRYWFGDEYSFSEVYARVKYFFDIESIEDSVGVLAEMRKNDGSIGPTFSLTSVWHNIHRDARHIEVFWENAHLEVKYSLLKVWGTLEIEGEETIEFNEEQMDRDYREFIGYPNSPPIYLTNYGYETLLFLDALVKGEPNSEVAHLEDSRRSHELVEACYKSSREKRPIEV